MPRFVLLGNVVLKRELIQTIDTMRSTAKKRYNYLFLKIPYLFSFIEREIKVRSPLSEVVEILNKYQ